MQVALIAPASKGGTVGSVVGRAVGALLVEPPALVLVAVAVAVGSGFGVSLVGVVVVVGFGAAGSVSRGRGAGVGGATTVGRLGGVLDAGSGAGSGRVCSSSFPRRLQPSSENAHENPTATRRDISIEDIRTVERGRVRPVASLPRVMGGRDRGRAKACVWHNLAWHKRR